MSKHQENREKQAKNFRTSFRAFLMFATYCSEKPKESSRSILRERTLDSAAADVLCCSIINLICSVVFDTNFHSRCWTDASGTSPWRPARSFPKTLWRLSYGAQWIQTLPTAWMSPTCQLTTSRPWPHCCIPEYGKWSCW